MSDSKNSFASDNVSDSSEYMSTTSEELPESYSPKKIGNLLVYVRIPLTKEEKAAVATLRGKLEDNVTASQENMLDNIFQPSQLNRSPWNFDCNFRPARYLKFGIEALNNLEVSCQLSGRIDVNDNGFNITVQNLSNYVLGHLHLKPDRFKCTKPLKGKSFSFLLLSLELAAVEDEGTVYLGNRSSGTDQLDILVLLEGTEYRRFFVKLGDNSAAIRKFPELSLFFTASVPSDDFGDMIRHLLQQKAPQVSVDIKNNTATLRAGNDNNSWTANYPMLKPDASRRMVAGESYSTSFEWTTCFNIVTALLTRCSRQVSWMQSSWCSFIQNDPRGSS
ncbi:uncharacterized protein LOC141595846 [Silene latifolia]|uniref:uncharacterized protein LOC141595846 n=1 Tax=Silene latifolia TaxID=37657 RepID=UPI003D78B0E8